MSFDWQKHKSKTDKMLRKSIVRNQDIPVQATSYKVDKEEEIIVCDSTDSDCVEVKVTETVKKKKNKKKKKSKKDKAVVDADTTSNITFRHPNLHAIDKNMDENFEAVNERKIPEVKFSDLSLDTKTFVRSQLTKQLNFKPDEKVYTHLLTLNDSVSCLLPSQQAAIKTKRQGPALAKDPEPELSDVMSPEDLNGLGPGATEADKFPDFDFPEISRPGKPNLNSLRMIVEHMQCCDTEFLMRRNVVTTSCEGDFKEDLSESSES